MPNIEWFRLVDKVAPHVVKIVTPTGSGTGFLVRRTEVSFGVLTAGHVVRDALSWKQHIEIWYHGSDSPTMLIDSKRLVLMHPNQDSAYVQGALVDVQGTLPDELIELVPAHKTVKAGVEVGWLGFPYIVPVQEKPCFFSGHISAVAAGRYFIDGVAIPGVSGGPAFYWSTAAKPARLRILGTISAYHSARAGGEAIPGLMVSDDCTYWAGLFESMDSASDDN